VASHGIALLHFIDMSYTQDGAKLQKVERETLASCKPSHDCLINYCSYVCIAGEEYCRFVDLIY
jgi:hypothetical protein